MVAIARRRYCELTVADTRPTPHATSVKSVVERSCIAATSKSTRPSTPPRERFHAARAARVSRPRLHCTHTRWSIRRTRRPQTTSVPHVESRSRRSSDFVLTRLATRAPSHSSAAAAEERSQTAAVWPSTCEPCTPPAPAMPARHVAKPPTAWTTCACICEHTQTQVS